MNSRIGLFHVDWRGNWVHNILLQGAISILLLKERQKSLIVDVLLGNIAGYIEIDLHILKRMLSDVVS